MGRSLPMIVHLREWFLVTGIMVFQGVFLSSTCDSLALFRERLIGFLHRAAVLHVNHCFYHSDAKPLKIVALRIFAVRKP
jgi:hypothetical protein